MNLKENPENPENPEKLENTLTSAMNVKTNLPQQPPDLIDSLCAWRTAGVVSDEQFIRMMRTLQDDNGVATMDITYTDAHRSCVSKKPTPLDLGVTQTTAASTKPASKEWEDL
jgi:hypothetical protein